jgi:hypothetical protein
MAQLLERFPRQIRRITLPILICAMAFVGCSRQGREAARPDTTASEQPRTAAPSGKPQGATEKDSHSADSSSAEQTKVFLGKPSRSGTTVSFPVHLHGGGQKIGLIHLEVSMPDSRWRFLSFDASDPQLEASPALTSDEDAATTVRKLEISNGDRVIPNGLIGNLEFSVPVAGEVKPPALRILDTWPPEKSAGSGDSVTDSAGSGSPSINDPSPKAPENPAMSCFFFSH